MLDHSFLVRDGFAGLSATPGDGAVTEVSQRQLRQAEGGVASVWLWLLWLWLCGCGLMLWLWLWTYALAVAVDLCS
jgi:hypothetical protein